MSDIRVRMAPSPTGALHIGTVRTALFNYLYAKHVGGTYVLRIEDTDKTRSTVEFEEQIVQGLTDLGLVPDEGVGVGGPYGPYKQSERVEIYHEYLQKLLDDGKAYYCYCTKDELEAERERCEKEKLPPRYSGKCRELTREPAEGAVIRFKTPQTGEISYEDTVRGKVTVQVKELDDFVIAKNLDEALYNFSVVIDDITMKITHVIRGEDHISNTPKQILIYQALGFTPPQFAHLPLILNEDRSKLSKRKNKVEFRDYLAQGYLPEALVNFLALLGWNPGDDREIFSLPEIIKEFSLERVQKSGAVFDIKKLNWMNGQWIRKLSIEELASKLKPFLQDNKLDEKTLKKAVQVTQSRLEKLAEASEHMHFFFELPVYEKSLLIGKNMDEALAKLALEKSLELVRELPDWEALELPAAEEMMKTEFLKLIEKLNLKTGQVLWPVRAALSGTSFSPGAFEMLWVLGREESVGRLESALGKF
ncbi:MAG: glutamate--tRNA ligase [Candidatus Gracilibacteria bacterium]|nr:glutamate--tRNA ligase [Candidatus Gracilibacteria bacterium]